jgi:hypothetical protein
MIYEASWRSLATRPRGKRPNERSPRSTALSLSASASACVSKRRISIGITKVHLDKYGFGFISIRDRWYGSIVAQPLRQRVRQRLRFCIGDDPQTSGPDLMDRADRNSNPSRGPNTCAW